MQALAKIVVVALLAFQVTSVRAADPPLPPIRLPASVAPIAPSTITELAADAIFVIECDAPCLVLASRMGFVSITEEVGPIRMRGRFADGTKIESRTYKAKQIWILEALTAGEVEILVVPAGVASEAGVIRRTLLVGGVAPKPRPNDPIIPKPIDPKPDDPKPEPLPVPLGLDKIVLDAVQSYVPASERAIAAKIAENYRIVATSLTTKEAEQEWKTDPEAAGRKTIKTLFEMNTKLGYKRETWSPVWRAIGDRLAEARDAGAFLTRKQYIAVCAELSLAFAGAVE